MKQAFIWAIVFVATIVIFQNCSSGFNVVSGAPNHVTIVEPPETLQPYAVTPSPTPTGPYVQLNWASGANSEQDSFVIEQSTDGSTFKQVATIADPKLTVNIYGLTTGTTYYYRLKAVSGAGTSSYSSITKVAF